MWQVTSRFQNKIHSVEFRIPPLCIVVSRWIDGIPNKWYLSCGQMFNRKELLSEEIESAKSEAMSIVEQKLAAILETIEKHSKPS